MGGNRSVVKGLGAVGGLASKVGHCGHGVQQRTSHAPSARPLQHSTSTSYRLYSCCQTCRWGTQRACESANVCRTQSYGVGLVPALYPLWCPKESQGGEIVCRGHSRAPSVWI